MRRRWLAGIFAVSMSWAILVAVFTSDHVHRLWGVMAAVGYGVALAAVLVLRHRRTADIAVGVAPLAYGALAFYMWWRVLRDWTVGWSARHPAVNR